MIDRVQYDYDRDDPTFIADLRESVKAVEVVAQWLNAKGYSVVIRPTFERPSPAQMGEYADEGDLEVLQRVEVKRRLTLTFTGKDDFPYESLIVDACHCFDRARPKPYAYVILNREMTVALVVRTATREAWTRTRKHDRQKGRDREFYECPLDLVTVENLA